LKVKESWSGRVVSGNFVPPYTSKQLNALQKKLTSLDSSDAELRENGHRLFLALCGSETPGTNRREASEQSVQAMLRSVIQRTLRRRGTVALTLNFGPGCDEFVRYPWELLHNGDHFLVVSGIFTLTRALLRPDMPAGCELPVHPPLRVLYIGSSPTDCDTLETEQSFAALERGLATPMENGDVFLDRLEPPTFDELVRYLNSCGGVSMLDDRETTIPCYVIHFDGHGAYGRLCSRNDCNTLNEAHEHTCRICDGPLSRVKAQTYLCFCNEDGGNRFIDTQSLRELFLSSDVRLAVFSACETATVSEEYTPHHRRHAAVDATLATALVMAQVPAVVAMPFSLQDDLSPTFVYHFYEALADGRTLEEALSRARQALLPTHQKSWFIPVLYRHVVEGQESPVPLLAKEDAPQEYDHPLAHLNPSSLYVGREQELQDLNALLAAARGEQFSSGTSHLKLRPGTHHIALTGPPGIGKSALAGEVVRRNQEQFPGGVIGVSLEGSKSFGDALLEMLHALHAPPKTNPVANLSQRERAVVGTLRSRASRELPCLLLLDGFEEVKDRAELETWLHFLCSLPQEVVVLVTSRSNPENMLVLEGVYCRWYEYRVGNMADADLLKLFAELASATGLDQRIHLDDPQQQAVLQEICTLLDGYPLGAQLIFGTAQKIRGRVFTPEAATRSLEEVRDELQRTPLEGILAVLEVAYRRLTPLAQLLLAYLACFKLPFSREQILMLVAPETLSSEESARLLLTFHTHEQNAKHQAGEIVPAELAQNWRAARDELVQASFIQFDGRVYTIHPQVRYFALSQLPLEERRRVHRVVAAYYCHLPQPSPEEWFAAFEHFEEAGEPQDLQEAVRVAVQASWALNGRGHVLELLSILRRAGVHVSLLGDKRGEGQVQCCLGGILRQQGHYSEAEACLRSSLEFHKALHDYYDAGRALYELAMLFREEGNFQQAGIYAQEALSLFREVGHATGEARMQLVMGEVRRGCGAYYDALGHFDLALTSFDHLHNKEGCAQALRDRGTVYAALGQYTKALNDCEEALRLFSELGLRTGQAWVLTDESSVYTDQGKLDLAEKLGSEAMAIFREHGIRRGEGWALRAMGDIARERRNAAKARIQYEEAQAIFHELGDRVDSARVLCSLGAIFFDESEYLAAKEMYEQAQAIAHEQGAKQIDGRALRGLGDVARVFHQFAEAERCYQKAATIAIDLDTPAEHCAVLRRQGLLYQAQEKYREALDCWVHVLALDVRLRHPARTDLQEKVSILVAEHHLEELYAEFCRQYNVE
jgi:tetratricopeptide (TPR) repeat protein